MTGTPAAAGGAGTAAAAGTRAPTAPSAGAPARQAPAAGDPARPAPAERGRTVVADRAVRRIAERAAAETDLAGRRARVTHGSAVVHGRRADVSVDVRLPYPAVLGEAGEKVRGRMADRVAELSGLTVREATVRVQSLSPDRAAPQPPPAHGSTRSGGRATRRRPWSARRIPAALVALTAAAACAFVLYDILSVHLAGRRPAGPRTEAVDWLSTHGPGDTAVVAGGAVAAALGLWLLCLALTPGLRGVLPMAPVPGHPGQRAVLDRAAAAELVRDAASAVPGVSHVRVRCGRSRVRVRARLSFGDRTTTRATLRSATDTALATLGLSRRLTPRISLRPDAHWRPPGTELADGVPLASGAGERKPPAADGPVRGAGPKTSGDETAPLPATSVRPAPDDRPPAPDDRPPAADPPAPASGDGPDTGERPAGRPVPKESDS